jgi:hypothetical protein
MPESLSLLRHKLSQKAKQELLAHACGKGIWERRMRETCTSGATRGERVNRTGMRILRHERGELFQRDGKAAEARVRRCAVPASIRACRTSKRFAGEFLIALGGPHVYR